MSCRDKYITKITNIDAKITESMISQPLVTQSVERLLFGVDSEFQSNDLLQNNINHFEWVIRNKIYPNFWGRSIVGNNSLTKNEIKFLHDNGCKIAVYYNTSDPKLTDEQGKIIAKKAVIKALELGIPEGTAVFLEINNDEDISRDYMRGYANALIAEGYTPGFKANTDAKYIFDREFSHGVLRDRDIFNKCLIWAIAPCLVEYESMKTSHLIHPDNWMPFAPSSITRKEIAIWQYGKNCHTIEDNAGEKISFNLNLVRNEQVIIEKMF